MAHFDASRHDGCPVDVAGRTRKRFEALEREAYPDPGAEPEACADEAWRRQSVRDAWETREAEPRPESSYRIANARPEERFEGAVRAPGRPAPTGALEHRGWCPGLRVDFDELVVVLATTARAAAARLASGAERRLLRGVPADCWRNTGVALKF